MYDMTVDNIFKENIFIIELSSNLTLHVNPALICCSSIFNLRNVHQQDRSSFYNLNGFSAIHSCRTQSAGGLAVFVSNGIQCWETRGYSLKTTNSLASMSCTA